MKKILIALMLLGSIFANTFAQEYDVVEVGEEVDFNTEEVYATAGIFSGIGMFFLIIGSIANSKDDKAPFIPSLTAGYNHYFSENFALGGVFTYENWYGINFMTLQAKVTGLYGWEHFKIYHALGAGITIIPDNGDKTVFPAIDATVLGLKLDYENWSVFIEGCFPETGFVKVGASYKF